MTTPDTLKLDPSRLEAAIAAVNTVMASAVGPDPEVRFDVDDFTRAATLGALLEEYDYGEPLHNGTLMLLARHLLVPAPTTLRVETLDELPEVESEYISHFHHGDVIVSTDLGVWDSTWITGNLQVEGVIEASYLDAYQDLMVGGDVRCRAMQMMGLSLIAGTLDCEHLAYVHSQGENWVLGGVRAPCLIGEDESTADWDASRVTHHIDLDDDKEALAKLLGVAVEPDDEYAFMVVLRAIDKVRSAP